MLESFFGAMVELSEQELQTLYAWIDEVPLSRPKKNIARDFSDGVMAAEIVSHFFPRIVELHNYTAANSSCQKLENWRLLNRKVFLKVGLNVPDELLQSVVACKPGVIEYILDHLKSKIEHIQKVADSNGEFNPLFGTTGFPEHSTAQHHPHHFNSTAGNMVINQMQDNRHSMVSPSAAHQMVSPSHKSLHQQASVNLPPLVKSPLGTTGIMTHPSKLPKPSHIPRPTLSGNSTTSRQTLPPINSQQMNGGGVWNAAQSKLPIIKDRSKLNSKGIPSQRSKKDINYSSHHLGVPSHWFRRASNAKDGSAATASGLSKEGMLIMAEKDQMIMELQETVQLLQMKVKRLEHLIKIKDYKLQDNEKHASNTGKTGQTMR